jgi:hypothetical protein
MFGATLFHLLFSSDEEVDEHSTSNIKYPVKSDLQQNDIIQPAYNSVSHNTDANIDASCNRTHYGSNWVVCVGKSILTFYN